MKTTNEQVAKMHAIPEALRDAIDLGKCTITTNAALHAGYSVEIIDQGSCTLSEISDDAVVVLLPGWTADDGNASVDYPSVEHGRDAARAYVADGEWGDRTETSWVTVQAWRTAYILYDSDCVLELRADSDSHLVTLPAEEPDCDSEEGHAWESPYEVVGGIKDNPGCRGHGGGVIMREVCANCGAYQVTDTWAQDRESGEQGLTKVSYEPADDVSLEWLAEKSDG